jgi:hypothetical protein
MPKTIKVTLPDEYYAEIMQYCEAMGHITIQDMVKLSLRRYMNLYKKGKTAPGA